MLGVVLGGNGLTIMALAGMWRLNKNSRDLMAYGMVALPFAFALISGIALSEAHRSPDGVSGSGQTAEP
jgi:hypothetical protein